MRIMKRFKPILTICLVLTLFSISAELQAAPPAEPAKLQLELDPVEVFAGGETELTLLLTPIEGVKINRYPKIKLEFPDQSLLKAGATASIGTDARLVLGEEIRHSILSLTMPAVGAD